MSPKKYLLSSCFRFNFHNDLKDRKDTWKGYERKDKDIKENKKKTNIKLKDKVYFIAFHNDNRFQNVFWQKSVFPFFFEFCEKYISIFKLQLPIIVKSYFAAVRRAKSRYFFNFHHECQSTYAARAGNEHFESAD